VTRRGVLDTSILIANGITPIPGELAISVVSIAKLQFGVLVAKTPEAQAMRLARLSTVQRRFEPLPVDEAVADSYGQLAAAVVGAGRNHGPGRWIS
jgi:predicted nucleic acid-binding protein